MTVYDNELGDGAFDALHLIIDGDTVAFRIAAALQKPVVDLETGMASYEASIEDSEYAVDNLMSKMTHGINPKMAAEGQVTYSVYLSDKTNFRYRVLPTYKSNRKDSVLPLLLGHLKSYLRSKYGAVHYDDLEADDVVGLMMTRPMSERVQRVACGRDKDFLSIPGYHHQFTDDDERGNPIVRYVSQEQGDWWHLRQTLTGDAVDGYEGCPGLGPIRAEAALNSLQVLEPHRSVITRGPNKGKETVKWVGRPMLEGETLWDVVVSQFEKGRSDEMGALTTARVARILRWGEYDFDTAEVHLWKPPIKE